VFCCQRGDTVTVGPADDIDPEYGRLLRQAAAAGVEIVGPGVRVKPQAICPTRLIHVKFEPFEN
jgi:sugar fermentation stimulation protein A